MNKEPYFLMKFIGGVCGIAGGALFLSMGTEEGLFNLLLGGVVFTFGVVLILSLAKSNYERKNKNK